ncbi:hypothetical protein BH24ACT13_BH24ACT13_07150 [soil metagenome]
MKPAAQTVVKFSTTDDILGVLPYRIGFVPSESVVMMCMVGPRRRDELVVRVDLLPDDQHEVTTGQLLAAVDRVKASTVFVACYTEAADDTAGVLPRRPLIDGLVERLQKRGVDVLDAVLVRGGWRWSYCCSIEVCCPSAGTPLPAELTSAANRYVAEVVADGQALLPDRKALVASIRPPGNPIARAVRRQAYDRARDTLDSLHAGGGGPEQVRRHTIALLRTVLHRWAEGTHQVSRDEAILLALGFGDVRTRDEGITLSLEEPEIYLAVFTEMARHVEGADGAPVCAMLAWAALANGNGALSGVAVDRALACDPDYSLAHLIDSGLVGMMRAEPLREVTENLRADVRAGRW